MSDVGELVVRMIVSLAVVLAFVGGTYVVLRRRQSGGVSPISMGRRRKGVSAPRPLDVEARTGLARGSAAVAVRFADKVVLIGVTDGAPSTVLAEIPADEWDAACDTEDEPTKTPLETSSGSSAVVGSRPSFLDALRDATSRRV
ncbi:MAG: hypothetical protein AAGD33_09250 [Actinomycetota bacterium]